MKTDIETVSQVEVTVETEEEEGRSDPLAEYLEAIKVHRFEAGDNISIPTPKNDGFFGVKASDGGFMIMFSKDIFCVTDSMLEEARHDPTPLRDKLIKPANPSHACACSCMRERNYVEAKSKPIRIYYCGCPEKRYDGLSYGRWLETMMVSVDHLDEEEGTLWRFVGTDKRPMDWPQGWETSFCTECSEAIQVEDGNHWA